MFAPARRLTLLDVPLRLKFVAAGTFGPITVISGLVETCERVMFEPAANTKAVEEAVLAVPLVKPPAVSESMDTSADWLLAEMMMVLAAFPIPIFAPAEIDSDPLEPFNDVTTLVAAGAGTEIVTLPLPTPTEAIPAPEKFRRFEKVPAELDVVLPSAVMETKKVWTEADMVIVLAA